jgi:hypothetical protein
VSFIDASLYQTLRGKLSVHSAILPAEYASSKSATLVVLKRILKLRGPRVETASHFEFWNGARYCGRKGKYSRHLQKCCFPRTIARKRWGSSRASATLAAGIPDAAL